MKKLFQTIIIYIFLAALIYFLLNLNKFIKGNFWIALIIAAIITFVYVWSKFYNKNEHILKPEGFGRYSMHCKNCNWDWMSHITNKIPTQCPNCKENNNLEVIGWRKVSFQTKNKEDDLTKYLNK